MYSVTNDPQRLAGMFARLGLERDIAEPQTTRPETAIGQSNPALAQLKRFGPRMSEQEGETTCRIDKFYNDKQTARTNQELGYDVPSGPASRQNSAVQATMRRRPSFLLNNDAMACLAGPLNELAEESAYTADSRAKLEINAIVNSVKSQVEHVMSAAVQDAQRGDRICPLSLQPEKFPAFLAANSGLVRAIVNVCQYPQPSRDRLLEPALQNFAKAYFSASVNFPGAAKLRPENVHVYLNSTANSRVGIDFVGRPTAKLAIDSESVDQLCNELDDLEEPPDDGRGTYQLHLLTGFENQPMDKRRAGLYLQMLLVEAAQVEEEMGVDSANMPEHGAPAQRAARRTLEEWRYKGNEDFGDSVEREPGEPSQREMVTRMIEMMPHLNVAIAIDSGAPLITMPKVQEWLHSTDLSFDLRALNQPSARLLLQVAPIAGRALLNLPEFRN